jgi:hypothetical protein
LSSPSGSRSLLGFPDPEEEGTRLVIMLGTTHPMTQHHISEVLNLQQHNYENLRSHKICSYHHKCDSQRKHPYSCHITVCVSIQLPCYTTCPYGCHVTVCVHTAAMLHCMSIQLPCYSVCPYSCHVTLHVHMVAMLQCVSIQLPCYTACPYSCHVTVCVHTAAMLHCMSIQLPCYTACPYSCHVTLHVHTAAMSHYIPQNYYLKNSPHKVLPCTVSGP